MAQVVPADIQASTGAVVPFPGSAYRPSRPALRADEPRGEILLFTGVRYERSYATSPEPSPASSGEAKTRRPRRRS
jgi:hypothetical protein